jgi:hypothetical protein
MDTPLINISDISRELSTWKHLHCTAKYEEEKVEC